MAALVALGAHLHAARQPQPDPHPRGETESRSVNFNPPVTQQLLCLYVHVWLSLNWVPMFR